MVGLTPRRHGLLSLALRLTAFRLFTSEVGDYAGQYVKDADKALTDSIKAKGRLVVKESYTHRCVSLDVSLWAECLRFSAEW